MLQVGRKYLSELFYLLLTEDVRKDKILQESEGTGAPRKPKKRRLGNAPMLEDTEDICRSLGPASFLHTQTLEHDFPGTGRLIPQA